MKFEPAQYFSRHPALTGTLSRLDKTLLLMAIDSASRTVSPSLGTPAFNATSNFIRPNQ
jgi:hypothetical protein